MLIKLIEVTLGAVFGKLPEDKRRRTRAFILDLVRVAAKGGVQGLTTKQVDILRLKHDI